MPATYLDDRGPSSHIHYSSSDTVLPPERIQRLMRLMGIEAIYLD